MSTALVKDSTADLTHEIKDWPGRPAQERLGMPLLNFAKALFGGPAQRRLARAALHIDQIRHYEKELRRLSDAELRSAAVKLRGRARGGESLDRLLPEAFAMVCVAGVRALGLRLFDVQLAAGYVLHKGAIAEVATGEGKTLTAVAPVFLNALAGRGVHVTTVNDYLAKRDAEEWSTPVFNLLGVSVGYLQQKMADSERKVMYRRDVTHGTASEFGFDFLRDKLKLRSGERRAGAFWDAWLGNGDDASELDPRVQRGHHYALVDEADSIFIDDARTPLIIGGPTRQATPEESVAYFWADGVARQMARDEHFFLDEKKNKIELTDKGRQLIRWSNPPSGEHSHALDKLHEHVERALFAHHRYRRDQHYMIDGEKKVVLIDESTGRAQPDRHWRDGMHQAVEVKEGVPVTKASDHAAQITYQSYYKLYKKLAGMTGTAAQNWVELRRVYRLWVVTVPTNKPVQRVQMPDRVFPTEQAKFDAVVEEIKRLHAQGRPILVGTRSVDKSEELSRRLKLEGIDHDVLNARQHAQEAEIVKRAGLLGKVTVATNMAGRGTDIKPEKRVLELGGLHVLGTERHESLRIDRQLAGRAGRQGDVGSCQFFLSLEDELLEGLGAEKHDALKQFGKTNGDRDCQSYLPLFRTAQRRLERKHRRQRIDLMMWHKQREEILKELGADLHVD